MVSVIAILLVAIFKACADTMTHHYNTSVFKHLDFRFWNAEESYKYAKMIPYTKYRWDGWHIANSLWIITVVVGMHFHTTLLVWYLEIPLYGVIFTLTFNAFYNKVLRRP